MKEEKSPDGIKFDEPGCKADHGKVNAGVLADFGLALMEIAKIGTGGMEKYTRGGWQFVNNAKERYNDAKWRHLLKSNYVEIDPDFGLPHISHFAWCVLAELEMQIRTKIDALVIESGASRDDVIHEYMADTGTIFLQKEPQDIPDEPNEEAKKEWLKEQITRTRRSEEDLLKEWDNYYSKEGWNKPDEKFWDEPQEIHDNHFDEADFVINRNKDCKILVTNQPDPTRNGMYELDVYDSEELEALADSMEDEDEEVFLLKRIRPDKKSK